MPRYLLLSAVVLVGCTESLTPSSAIRSIAHEGPWHIPMDTLAAGDEISLDYVGAGPWIGEEGCAPGMEPGAVALRQYFLDWYPNTNNVWGYDCRPIRGSTSLMSVHATGRALDIMIPLAGDFEDDGAADNDRGDPLGNWLIENADDIGIQYIIWDQWDWMAARSAGAKDRSYGGVHPHHDHLHVELTEEAAAMATPFFMRGIEPPAFPDCLPVPKEGRTLDDTDECVQLFGSPEFWRSEEGVGHGGSLRWTNAFESANRANWARFILDFEEAGEYELEVYLEAEFSVYKDTRYAITHADGVSEVIVDQGAATEDGWASLGTFSFDPTLHQDVSVFDNSMVPVAEDQHISLDALRVTGEAAEEAQAGCGCRSSGSPGSWWACLVGLLAFVRRRRRRR